MKTLIFTANPSKKSFTHAIAKSFAENTKDTEVIDLYDEKYTQDFLRYEDIKDIPDDPKRTLLQNKMKKAENYVFIHPIFWGSPPAIMKNFIDQNFLAGFAYKFRKGSSMPVKLLTDKKAYIFTTSDSPSIIYRTIFRIPRSFWANKMLGVLPFCGIKIKHFTNFGKMRKSSLEIREKWLSKVAKIAKTI